MKPSVIYKNKLSKGLIKDDQLQRAILPALDKLHDDLTFNRLKNTIANIFRKKPVVKGLYLWGSVGVGKTFLMDCFYETLLLKSKQRIHFHLFLKQTHELLNENKGKKNPLKKVADQIAKNTNVICFDEMVIKDIADAMLIGGLIKELLSRGVCFVITSNIALENLYLHGLQRQNFLPAIKVLQESVNVVHIDSGKDYRQFSLIKEGAYFTPLGIDAHKNIEQSFKALATGEVLTEEVNILGRAIQVVKRSKKVLYTDFKALCDVPRSSHDYLELVKQFDTIILVDVFSMDDAHKNMATNFISLVDILYDARIKLIISAQVDADQLYTDAKLALEFKRTASRLKEMSSEKYLKENSG